MHQKYQNVLCLHLNRDTLPQIWEKSWQTFLTYDLQNVTSRGKIFERQKKSLSEQADLRSFSEMAHKLFICFALMHSWGAWNAGTKFKPRDQPKTQIGVRMHHELWKIVFRSHQRSRTSVHAFGNAFHTKKNLECQRPCLNQHVINIINNTVNVN